MKLGLPSMKKKKSVNPTGSHGPDKVVTSGLPLVNTTEHSHSINPLNHATMANEFGVEKK